MSDAVEFGASEIRVACAVPLGATVVHNEEEIDPAVAPVLRRGKRARSLDRSAFDLDRAAGWCSRAGKCIVYLRRKTRSANGTSMRPLSPGADYRDAAEFNHVEPTPPMFELAFLGTAAAVPSAERGLSAVLVTRGAHRFLIDCGEGTQRQLIRAGLGFRGLEHVLLTHAHLDHVLGLAGLLATLALYRVGGTVEIIGSGKTLTFVRHYLAETIGPEREGGYRMRSIRPGPVLSFPGWRVDAFAVQHRGTESLGYLFCDETRHPLLPKRLDALGVPEGPERAALAHGRSVVLADGRRISPEMVQGPPVAGAKLAIIGDAEEVASLVEPVRGADALVIEATFLERDAALARARGHLTAAAAGGLARDAEVGELLLTHISGRYAAVEILAEAAGLFPSVRVAADFDRVTVTSRSPVNS